MLFPALLSVAAAADLHVGSGQLYTTIADAEAAAVDGDRILIHAGVYAESVDCDKRLDFVGVGDPTWRTPGPGFGLRARRRGSVRGIVFDGDGEDGLNVWATDFSVSDCTFLDGSVALSIGDGVTVSGTTFRDNHFALYTGGGGGSDIVVRDSVFVRNDLSLVGPVRYVVRNRFEDNAAGPDIELDADGVVASNTFCGNDGVALSVQHDASSYVGTSTSSIVNNLFQDNVNTSASGPGGLLIRSFYGGNWVYEIVNNTFVGNDGPNGAHLYVSNGEVHLVNTGFARGGARAPGVVVATQGYGGAPVVTDDYDLYYRNDGGNVRNLALGAHTLTGVDPMIRRYTPNGDCTDDDLTPRAGSPLIDAGDPAIPDPDGTWADIGAYLY